MSDSGLIVPDWHLPAGVKAFVTSRQGGSSAPPFDGFNLALHVDDEPACVKQNRAMLQQLLLKASGRQDIHQQWVTQVHGTAVMHVTHAVEGAPEADALYTQLSGIACGILTADCLPVLLCSSDGQEVAVAHAGWRGLVAGVLEQTVSRFSALPEAVTCWLGPAIGPCHFEVGEEVLQAFVQAAAPEDSSATRAAFAPGASVGKYMADLYTLARIRLKRAGVTSISGSVCCTVCDAERWYSYRRDGKTGRNASIIMRVV